MEDGFNTNGYDSMRVSDRIKLLKDYLPEMLNSNSVIYGILSKGIHELSEEDCIQYFPIMCESIYAILRQWEEKRQEQEAKKRLEKSLSAIASKVQFSIMYEHMAFQYTKAEDKVTINFIVFMTHVFTFL